MSTSTQNLAINTAEEYISNFGLIEKLHPWVEFIADLSTPMAALTAFFFLPVFLAGWLFILKFFNVNQSLRTLMFFLLSAIYIFLIGWLKFESSRDLRLLDIKNRIVHYAVYHNSRKLCVGDIQHVKEKSILEAVGKFHDCFILDNKHDNCFTIRDSLAKVISLKEQDLANYVKAHSFQNKAMDIDSLILELELSGYGTLDSLYFQNFVQRHEEDFEIRDDDLVVISNAGSYKSNSATFQNTD
ncbi:MAG: hypothetical protein R2824_19730 [Saprospiraceae bacterium]